jgi:hypothetical protein
MKMLKSLVVAVCALSLLAAPLSAFAGCCDDAKKAGKACEHSCCVKAVKDGKVCEKCNPKKDDKKEDKKDDKKK